MADTTANAPQLLTRRLTTSPPPLTASPPPLSRQASGPVAAPIVRPAPQPPSKPSDLSSVTREELKQVARKLDADDKDVVLFCKAENQTIQVQNTPQSREVLFDSYLRTINAKLKTEIERIQTNPALVRYDCARQLKDEMYRASMFFCHEPLEALCVRDLVRFNKHLQYICLDPRALVARDLYYLAGFIAGFLNVFAA